MPRISTRNSTDTESEEIGHQESHVIPSSGDLDRDDFKSNFDTDPGPVNRDAFMKELKFMEEFVGVLIPKGSNPKAEEQYIDVGNNGTKQFIERGVEQKVRRKYVEVLARAKRDEITTPEYIDATGARATKLIKTPSLLHNFQVTEDTQEGRAWLRRILAEA